MVLSLVATCELLLARVAQPGTVFCIDLVARTISAPLSPELLALFAIHLEAGRLEGLNPVPVHELMQALSTPPTPEAASVLRHLRLA